MNNKKFSNLLGIAVLFIAIIAITLIVKNSQCPEPEVIIKEVIKEKIVEVPVEKEPVKFEEEPKLIEECSKDNLLMCNTENDCLNKGGSWDWISESKKFVCNEFYCSSNLEKCKTKSDCSKVGGQWEDGKCAQVLCGSVIKDENVILKEDLHCSGSIALVIGSDSVLDCHGHTISGTEDNVGISAEQAINNVIIKNCTIKNFKTGISLDAKLIKANTWNVKILNNKFVENVKAIYTGQTTKSVELEFSYNTFDNNTQGIEIPYFNQLVIKRNKFMNNDKYAMTLGGSINADWVTLEKNKACGQKVVCKDVTGNNKFIDNDFGEVVNCGFDAGDGWNSC